MKILIIGGTNKPEVTDDMRLYYQKYIDFFKASADTVTDDTVVDASLVDDLIISAGDGAFSIYDAHNKRELREYDALFLRGDGFRQYIDVIGTINQYALQNNMKIINNYGDVKDWSKLLQAAYFHKLDMPIARTIYVTSAVIQNEVLLKWSFPCIMKATHGSHGNNNYMVYSMNEVASIRAREADKRFVLQRLIPNSGDYRILIVGEEVLVISRRAIDGSHLNNTSKGGEAILVDKEVLPNKVIADAKRVMEYFDLTIAGIDALADDSTGEFFFLEVNAQPQLMSGAFISEKKQLMGKLLDVLHHER